MKHYLIHFKNGLFDVVNGDSASLHHDHLAVYSYEKDTAGEDVAVFAREAIAGYRVVSHEDAARYRLFWAELQLDHGTRHPAAPKGAGE